MDLILDVGAEDRYSKAVSSKTPVNRFEKTLSWLHFADKIRMDKICSFLTILSDHYLQFWPPSQYINADDSKVPYCSRHRAKQFICGKPFRYGNKIWCLNTPYVYVIEMEPYQGQGPVPIKTALKMGGFIVVDLLSELPM
ncbi:hypothetical protein RRG08_014158 [Elysia crispata]|uniref:PiggyBac transposable element-derived protein domain-containing protein n=1 Tax=Elysia crispata TaxID=231223 RepID=A0AAE0Z0B3_9GAST|nr:hypothetical protein RRG08_014158 [Elysia crispata]